MDVGIDYRDLLVSGRLPALARALGVSEETALGRFTISCFETQDKELILVTAKTYADAVGLRIEDPQLMLTAMVRAKLASPVETPEAGLGETQTWLLHGNDKHVAKLRHYRERASKGGIARSNSQAASSSFKHASSSLPAASKHKKRTESQLQAASSEPVASPGDWILDTGDHDPDLTSPVEDPISETRSSVSSESQSELALTAPPSAAAVALHVLDVKPPKRKERSPEQKKRSVNNAHLYRDLYEQAEGHQPAGLDQAFYGAMAKFSDKYGDDACHIIAWAFQCPDKSFRAKGWPLPLIIEQAPRLWRELNDPNKAIANIAAPRQQQQLALAAANEMAFTEFLARHGEVPNATR